MELRPFTDDDFASWRDRSVEHYARSRASAGVEPLEDARRTAVVQFAELLPDGLGTVGQRLFTLWDEGVEVGMIWIADRVRSDGTSWFGYDFEIREPLRRRGLGRRALEAVEERARSEGVVGLELNVFGDNLAARALYEQMGFAATSIQMRKPL